MARPKKRAGAPVDADLVSQARAAQARLLFDGTIQAGTLDANLFGQSLIGLSQALTSANRVLNGDRATVTVNVRANFKKGSFDVLYDVLQSVPGTIENVLGVARVYSPAEILAFMGLAHGAKEVGRRWITSAIDLVRKLPGVHEDITALAPDDGPRNLTVAGKRCSVRSEVLRLAQDIGVRSGLEKTVAPLSHRDVKILEFLPPSRRVQTPVESINKGEIPLFVAPRVTDLVSQTPEREVFPETTREAVLKIIKPGLEGSYEWMFEEEGRTKFSAPIEDKAFLEDRDNRRYSFAAGDSLRVKLAYRAVERGGKLSVEHRILEVLDKVEPAQQLTMPGGR